MQSVWEFLVRLLRRWSVSVFIEHHRTPCNKFSRQPNDVAPGASLQLVWSSGRVFGGPGNVTRRDTFWKVSGGRERVFRGLYVLQSARQPEAGFPGVRRFEKWAVFIVTSPGPPHTLCRGLDPVSIFIVASPGPPHALCRGHDPVSVFIVTSPGPPYALWRLWREKGGAWSIYSGSRGETKGEGGKYQNLRGFSTDGGFRIKEIQISLTPSKRNLYPAYK